MEEEYQFENRHGMPDEILKEFLAVVNRKAWMVLFAIAGLLLAYGVFVWIKDNDHITFWMNLVIVAGWIFLRSRAYKKQITKMREAARALYGNHEYQIKMRFGKRITAYENNKEGHLEYRRITAIYEKQHALILMLGKQHAVMVSKTGFTKGSLEAFRPFILQQCPQVKAIK